MSVLLRATLTLGLAAAGLALAAGPADAQAQAGQGCVSPPGMNYMICNGQRVPKPGNRVTNPDGSWREETRQGNCLVVREKTASGEFKESRRCD
jgi:ABC-type sugar transport system substrate-binding protein